VEEDDDKLTSCGFITRI